MEYGHRRIECAKCVMDFTEEASVHQETDGTVSISLSKIRNKWQTVINGLDYKSDPTVASAEELLTKLKKKVCNSGGHLLDGQYIIQGDKAEEVYQYLVKLGVPKIIKSGTK